MDRTYLGDGVYIDFDGYNLVLTTENGMVNPTNKIILEPEVAKAFLAYVEMIVEKYAPKYYVPTPPGDQFSASDKNQNEKP